MHGGYRKWISGQSAAGLVSGWLSVSLSKAGSSHGSAVRYGGGEGRRRCDRIELGGSLTPPQTAVDLRRKRHILR